MEQKTNLMQKGLLGVIYSLIALMVLFSFLTTRNLGEEGYNQCVQEKCVQRGDAFCQKARELSNCCLGAGGQLGQSNNQWVCAFE